MQTNVQFTDAAAVSVPETGTALHETPLCSPSPLGAEVSAVPKSRSSTGLRAELRIGNWKFVTAVLCTYGFLKEFRPIEPYIYNFLVADKNLTGQQISGEVFPMWTYSYLVLIIPVFLLTDLLRYKPVILLENAAYITTYALLIWGVDLFSQQMMQAVYGVASAAEVAYNAYLYAAVDKRLYKRATTYTRAALLFGRCLAYVTGQLVLSLEWADYKLLNYFTLSSLILSFCTTAALLLWITWRKHYSGKISSSPTIQTINDTHELNSDSKCCVSCMEYVLNHFKTLWRIFLQAYRSRHIWKWSLWWALGTCGYLQVVNYIQSLWGALQEKQGISDQHVYNGIVESINTGLGTVTLLSLQFVTVDWRFWGEPCLTIVSLFDCGLLLTMSQVQLLPVQYALYIVFDLSYQVVITIAQYNLALKMRSDSYGLVFGFNMFVALVLMTLLTFAIADRRGLNLAIDTQFIVYGGYYGIITVLFFCINCWTLWRVRRRGGQRSDSTEN